MTSKETETTNISMSNTKKEMLEAYESLKKKLEKQSEMELKPEQTQQAKKEEKIIKSAEKAAEANDATRHIYDLKDEISRFLADLAAKVEKEKDRYNEIKQAVEIRNKELMDIYEIEKSAHSLAALLEAQKQKKLEFENEMEQRKNEIEDEIVNTKINWEKEKQQYAQQQKEQKTEVEKTRKREKEEFEYEFNREKEINKRQVNDEMESLNKQLQEQKETFEKETAQRESDLSQRENTVSEREKYMDTLQAKVDTFPAELEKRILQAVKETTEQIKNDAKKNEEILVKGFEGEKNVLATKIQSLEKLAADQQKQIETLSRQMDNAYGKVQEIAMKAVSGKGQAYVPSKPLEQSENS
ncbi:MAG: hypothetical protein ACKVE4_07270 [Dissulfuribacterales bacterium]